MIEDHLWRWRTKRSVPTNWTDTNMKKEKEGRGGLLHPESNDKTGHRHRRLGGHQPSCWTRSRHTIQFLLHCTPPVYMGPQRWRGWLRCGGRLTLSPSPCTQQTATLAAECCPCRHTSDSTTQVSHLWRNLVPPPFFPSSLFYFIFYF